MADDTATLPDQTSDAPAGAPGTTPGGVTDGLQGMLKNALRGDVAFAVGIMAIIAMLLFPMPTWLLDMTLSISIAFAILVLMTALFIKHPLEFSAFPTVLLVATMLRLGLNIASTRLILSQGQSGEASAGQIIAAFGDLVMQGNFIIGVIVFAILVIVNFIVITKGSSRIAEVGARFSLDAMPGKQMAIDADLGSGLIDEATARMRRKALEAESNFYGSMDGASKFVRGDAVAGLLITGINVVAGVIIGMAQHQMPIGSALSTYATLTVGDGLVSQIPALVISIAAGMLVSKAGVEGAADKALGTQLTGYPQALALVSGVCFFAAIMPGMPKIPFLLVGGTAAYLAWKMRNRPAPVTFTPSSTATPQDNPDAPTQGPLEDQGPEEDPISKTLSIDDVRIELGYGLLPLINETEGKRLTDQIVALRKQMAKDMGFVTPSVRIIDNIQLPDEAYALKIKEMDAGQDRVLLGKLLAMDPRGAGIDLPGEDVREPAFGLPARWVSNDLKEEATFRGYTVVDPPTVLVTHLTEVVKDHMADLLNYAAMEELLDDLPEHYKKLLEDITPVVINRSSIQHVLQSLLRERVSIRDLPTIIEAIAEIAARTKDIMPIVEHVRTRLARQICHANQGPDGTLAILAMSPEWEQSLLDALVGEGVDRQLALAPSQLHQFINAVRNASEAADQAQAAPVLLTGPMTRPYVRSMTERFMPQMTVMSQNEIHPRAKLRQVGTV